MWEGGGDFVCVCVWACEVQSIFFNTKRSGTSQFSFVCKGVISW